MSDSVSAQQDRVHEILDYSSGGPGPHDEAANMLSELFGNDWWSILWNKNAMTGDPALLMPVLQWFNAIVMVAVGLILLYVVGHAMIGSAHEGTPLGRRLHSIWVPVRSVLAISLLAPIPWNQCLNFVQGVVLMFIGVSIQFANLATNEGLEFLAQNDGHVVVDAPAGIEEEGVRAARVILHNCGIQAHQAWFQDKDLIKPYEKTVKTPAQNSRIGSSALRAMKYALTPTAAEKFTDYKQTRKPTKINYRFLPPEPYSDDTMGGITIFCKDPNSSLCATKQDTLKGFIKDLRDIASRKIERIHGEDIGMPPPSYVNQLIDIYADTIAEKALERVDADNPAFQREMDELQENIKTRGFALLGAYSWTMSRFSQTIEDEIDTNLNAADYSSKVLMTQTVARFNQIQTNLHSLDSYIESYEYERELAERGFGDSTSDISMQNGEWDQPEETDGGKSAFDQIGSLVSKPFVSVTDEFIMAMSTGDPIASLSHVGRNLLNGCQVAIGGVLGVSAIPGFGKTAGMIGVGLLAPVFLLGITLAYYLPAVPFLIWAVALFSWVIMVLEALVAAPVWAAMHALPDGEGMAGDRAQAGYALFMQLLLRPVLMVIGFFFAMLLVRVVGYIGGMFTIFFHGIAAEESFVGPITAGAGIAIGSIMIVILVHKAFQLVFLLPERLNDWMGNQQSSMGEAGDMHESKQTIVGGVATHSSRSAGQVGNAAHLNSVAGKDGGGEAKQAMQKSQADDLQPGETGKGDNNY